MVATNESTMLGKILHDAYSSQVSTSRPDIKYLQQCMALLPYSWKFSKGLIFGNLEYSEISENINPKADIQ